MIEIVRAHGPRRWFNELRYPPTSSRAEMLQQVNRKDHMIEKAADSLERKYPATYSEWHLLGPKLGAAYEQINAFQEKLRSLREELVDHPQVSNRAAEQWAELREHVVRRK